MEHDGVEYCFQCGEYPCSKYEHIDDYDSFVTHGNQKADMKKAHQIGMEAYNAEQEEKARILDILLAGYNDGRKKTTVLCSSQSAGSARPAGGTQAN